MAMTTTRLVAARAGELRFEAYARPQAPLLLCPSFALLGALPWVSGELDAIRLAVSAACLSLSAFLALRSRPRRAHIVLRPEQRTVEMAGETREIATPAQITLDVCHDDTEAPRGRYVAAIELAGGDSVALLVNAEPDTLLRQLHRVMEHVPARVECRWGLPAGAAPWTFDAVSMDGVPASEGGAPLLSQRISPLSLVRVTAIATGLVLLDLTLLVSSQQARLAQVHPLSILLPVAMGTFLVGLTIVLATRRVRLSAGSWIRRDIGALGLRSHQRAARIERVRGVYVIGAAEANGRHILLDTSDGPIAVWSPRAVAGTRARQISRAIEQRSRETLPNLGSIASAPHTSPGA